MITLSTTIKYTCISTAMCFGLLVSPIFLEGSFAKPTVSKNIVPTASSEVVLADNIDFDGQGTLDAINPLGQPLSQDSHNSLASALVIVNGQQMRLTSDVEILDERSQPLTADAISSGMFIGYKKDPSDLISKIWILNSEKVAANTRPAKTTPEKEPAQRISTPIQFVDGVWKN